jgi:hypothetical protein
VPAEKARDKPVPLGFMFYKNKNANNGAEIISAAVFSQRRWGIMSTHPTIKVK